MLKTQNSAVCFTNDVDVFSVLVVEMIQTVSKLLEYVAVLGHISRQNQLLHLLYSNKNINRSKATTIKTDSEPDMCKIHAIFNSFENNKNPKQCLIGLGSCMHDVRCPFSHWFSLATATDQKNVFNALCIIKTRH